MKKVIIFCLFFALNVDTYSQTIEVIDAIAGTLIPKITESVKGIIGENVKTKKQEEVKQKVEEAIKNSRKELITSLNSELAQVASINLVHEITRRMIFEIGAVDLLSDRNLLTSLGDAQNVRNEYARQYVSNINGILEDRKKLEEVKITTFDGSLRDKLKEAKEDMDDAIGRIKTELNFAQNQSKITFQVSSVDGYISAIERSGDHIDELQEAAEDISRLIETYFEAYNSAFNKLKSEIETESNN